jgi:hypothetical protein
VLPSSGSNSGNTRVSIIGTGFSAPVQVFFGNVEAVVVNVSFSQIVVLSPPAFGAGSPNLNATVNVRVHEVNSGTDATLASAFRYTPAVQIISFEGNNNQPIDGPFTPITIHGQGFEAPVKVSLGGFIAAVLSVSATEIQCLPLGATPNGCTDISGPMTVTNIDTGDSATGQIFIYSAKSSAPVIQSVTTPITPGAPVNGMVDGTTSTLVTVTGANLFNAVVSLGGQNLASSVNATGTILTFTAPPLTTVPGACPTGVTPPGPVPAGSPVDITITNGRTTCSTTFKGAIQYMLPCT